MKRRDMDRPASPKISVCIPTYNYAHYITDAIKSACAQTFTDIEILVLDDCSTDNTCEIVSQLAKADSRIAYIQNASRRGFVGNFTRCIEAAAGEYVKILCADDLLTAACLEKMVKVLDENENVSLVSCSRQLADGSLNKIEALSYPARTSVLPGAEVIRKCLFSGNLIGEPTAVLFRKRDALRGFNAGYSLLVDLEMWFYLLEKGDLFCLPDILCTIRRHEGQATYDCVKTLSFVDDIEKLYQEFIRKPYMHYTFLSSLKKRLGMTFIVWSQRTVINDPEMVRQKIGRFMNYYLALIVMPLYLAIIKTNEFIRTYARVASCMVR